MEVSAVAGNQLTVYDIDSCVPPFCAQINDPAPLFSAEVYHPSTDTVETIALENYGGRWVVLFFYSNNFSFVCPTELAAMAALYPQFESLNAEVLGISTEGVFTQKVSAQISPSVSTVTYPLVSDRSHFISRAYRVLNPATGANYRATLLIDPEGVIKARMIYPPEVGRNANEILRVLQGIQYGIETGEGVPANWVPGMPGIVKDPGNIGKV
ncbi:peroxiredoxin [Alteribacter keqinensis]|uniref:Peroxiredoxin n=1 Tax=Alteribacter keqinensis TaxID=2483800 RepID=A0A3M7TLC8_9BACI|nr:peroxiredoxin [Alteribacter keqinensis]RNA66278.1 peroxiredoxin [Alteribacter keqinensis]